MKSVSGKALCKIVKRRGWELKRITGSHHLYAKKGVKSILSIPVHGNRDLPLGTLKSLMKDGGLTEKGLQYGLLRRFNLKKRSVDSLAVSIRSTLLEGFSSYAFIGEPSHGRLHY